MESNIEESSYDEDELSYDEIRDNTEITPEMVEAATEELWKSKWDWSASDRITVKGMLVAAWKVRPKTEKT